MLPSVNWLVLERALAVIGWACVGFRLCVPGWSPMVRLNLRLNLRPKMPGWRPRRYV